MDFIRTLVSNFCPGAIGGGSNGRVSVSSTDNLCFQPVYCHAPNQSPTASYSEQDKYIRNRRLSLAEIGSDSHFQRVCPLPSASESEPVSPRDGHDRGRSEKGTNSAVIHRKRCSALKGLQSRPLESLLHSGRGRPAGVFTPETPTQRRAALWNPAQREASPWNPAHQGRAVPGTLAQPSAGWNRASVPAPLD